MDTFFLIYIEGICGTRKVQKTFGPYLSFSEASTVMLEYTELILETEGIFFSAPHKAVVMEVLPNAGHWLEIAIRAKDSPAIEGDFLSGRLYEESI